MTPDANDLCVFAVKRGYIESKEIQMRRIVNPKFFLGEEPRIILLCF